MATRARYSGFDFKTINDDLLAKLQVEYADIFNDFAVSSLAIMLLDLIAYGLDGLSFYLDRRALEQYLETATTRRGVARLTRQLGYKMRSAVASAVDGTLSVPTAYGFAIPLRRGFQFQGPNGLIFELARDVTFAAGETGPSGVAKLVPLYQGQTFNESFVSDGTANQVFDLRRVRDGKYAVQGTVGVVVDGGPWSESPMLRFETSNQFEVGYNDDPPTVRFGDGIAGNIPPAGATVSVTYVATSGKAGQITKRTITAEVSPLVVVGTTIQLSITNAAGSDGGDDPESLDEARVNAPASWNARHVAVTQPDYEAVAGSFADPLAGRVAVAQALVSRSADDDLALRSYLKTIRDQVGSPVVPTTAAVASLRSRLANITAELDAIQASLTSLAGHTSTTNAAVAAMLTAGRQAQGAAAQLSAVASAIGSNAAAVKAILSTFSVVGAMTTEQIRQTTLNSLNAMLDGVTASASVVTTEAGVVTTAAAAVSTQGTTASGELTDAGTDLTTPGTDLFDLAASRSALVAIVGVDGTTPTAAYNDLRSIEAVVVDDATSAQTTIETACAAIFAHVDKILADDCQANLVTVPILSKDAGGFYVAPSNSLIQALQAHLDECKEVSQTVVVTSGSDYLLPAALTVRVGVLANYSLTVIQTAVQAAIDGILRGRKFGAALYVFDFRGLSSIEGVVFANVTINGYQSGAAVLTDRNDVSGNLIALRRDLLTKGTVNITTEFARPLA